MPTRRVINNIPQGDLPFVLATIAADGGRVISQEPEPDGKLTVVVEFPDRDAPPAAADTTPSRRRAPPRSG